jgi:hypothetical protein
LFERPSKLVGSEVTAEILCGIREDSPLAKGGGTEDYEFATFAYQPYEKLLPKTKYTP